MRMAQLTVDATSLYFQLTAIAVDTGLIGFDEHCERLAFLAKHGGRQFRKFQNRLHPRYVEQEETDDDSEWSVETTSGGEGDQADQARRPGEIVIPPPDPIICSFMSSSISAAGRASCRVPPHELTAQQMADVLFRIVQVESPVHEDELTARVRDLWGLGRAGSRIQDIVARGIRALLVSGRCQREDACLFLPEAPVRVRSREVVRSASLRKVDLLPPQELCVAIESVVGAHYGASPPEIAVAVSRLLGFKAMSAGLRETIERQVQTLKVKGRLREQDGLFRINIVACARRIEILRFALADSKSVRRFVPLKFGKLKSLHFLTGSHPPFYSRRARVM